MIAIKGREGISEAEVLINTSKEYNHSIVVATNEDKSYIYELAEIMKVKIPEVITMSKLRKTQKIGCPDKVVLMYNMEKCISSSLRIRIPVCSISADTKGIAPYNGDNLDDISIKPGEVKEA